MQGGCVILMVDVFVERMMRGILMEVEIAQLRLTMTYVRAGNKRDFGGGR